MKNRIIILLGPLLAAVVGFLLYYSGNDALMCKAAAVLVLMAYWWITEAVNIFITSLMPIIIFPLMGVMDIKEIRVR